MLNWVNGTFGNCGVGYVPRLRSLFMTQTIFERTQGGTVRQYTGKEFLTSNINEPILTVEPKSAT